MPQPWHQLITNSHPKFSLQQGCAQVVDGRIFYSPNSSSAIQVPQPISDPHAFLKTVLDGNAFNRIEQPQWWSDRLPYLPFIPLKPAFNFESLQCLARLPNPSLSNGYYVVAPLIRVSWCALEKDIIATTEALMHLHNFEAVLPPRPSTLSFSNRFTHANEFKRALFRTREAFVIWTAAISFLISLSISSDPGKHQLPLWFRELAKHSLSEVWLDCVRSSFIGTFRHTCPRAGVLVDISAPSQCPGAIEWFYDLQIPVWYPWGEAEAQAALSDPCVARLAPPPHQLQKVAGFLTKSIPEEISPSQSAWQHSGPSASWSNQKPSEGSTFSPMPTRSANWGSGVASSTGWGSSGGSSTGWGSSGGSSTGWGSSGGSSTGWGSSGGSSTGWGSSGGSSTGWGSSGGSSTGWGSSGGSSTGWGSSEVSSLGWGSSGVSGWGSNVVSSTGWSTTQVRATSQSQGSAMAWGTPGPPPSWDTTVLQVVGSLQQSSERKRKDENFSRDNKTQVWDGSLAKRPRIEELPMLNAKPHQLVSANGRGGDCGDDKRPWVKFFARRAEYNKKYLANESFIQKQTRENRTRQPGMKKVFEWVIDDKKGHYVRQSVPKNCIDEAWAEYGKHMRRYDPITNEWDLCQEFGPLDEDQIAEDEETHAWYLNMDGKQNNKSTVSSSSLPVSLSTQAPTAVCETALGLASPEIISKVLTAEQRDNPALAPVVPQAQVALPQMTATTPETTALLAPTQNSTPLTSLVPLASNSPSLLLSSEPHFTLCETVVALPPPEATCEPLALDTRDRDIPVAALHDLSQTQGTSAKITATPSEVTDSHPIDQNLVSSASSIPPVTQKHVPIIQVPLAWKESNILSSAVPPASPPSLGHVAGEAETSPVWEDEPMGLWIEKPSEDVVDPIVSELLHALHSIYGFLKPADVFVDSSAPLDDKAKSNLYTAVGFDTADADLPLPLASSARQFLDLLSSDSSKIPSAQWDMAPGNRLFSNMPHLSFCARVKDCFVFDFGSQATMPWHLAVQKPALAVMVGRMDASFTDYDIASELVKIGAPFRTLLKVQGRALVQSPAPADSLIPVRQHKYTFTMDDYNNYVSRRDAFLRGPRGRAALLKGGYVWRLAVDALGYGVCFDGPSEEATLHGHGYLLDVANSAEACHEQYWDDDLSEDELNLICGMYYCETAVANQFSHQSWFPLHMTWTAAAATAFDHWTMRNEMEYFRRLESITEGAQPKTASMWAQNIKALSHIRRLHNANTVVSSDVLSELIPV